MEARDDDNKRPTPKIGGNNGGVEYVCVCVCFVRSLPICWHHGCS